MLSGLAKFWRDLMTENNGGTTYCPVRIFGASGVLTYLGQSVFMVVKHGVFDAMGFATGFAALIAAIGGAIGMKSKMGADAP